MSYFTLDSVTNIQQFDNKRYQILIGDDIRLRIIKRSAIFIALSYAEGSMEMLKQTSDSPVGTLFITIENAHITKISYDEPVNWEILAGEEGEIEIYQQLLEQLAGYFVGEREVFDLPIFLQGTPFQQRVWQALSEIPYGVVVSYKDIAIAAGSPKAVQAVGQANRANPIPILIPCHRCVKSDGALGGYNGADIDKKQYLLALEKGLRLS